MFSRHAMAEVFISYSKSDRTHALDLASELRAHGFSVWIDQGSIGGAKNWATEIVEAIDSCSTFVCLLSSHSLASHNVAKELHLASEKQKNILPVIIEKVKLPSNFEYPLAGLQRVYYDDRPAIFQALELLHGVVATELLPTASLPEDDSIRIAVLPFDDLSPQHDNQWFADGMMDELISTLGGIESMKIPSRSDVLHYRDHLKKSHDVATELGVRYLIEGAVRKSGEKIRINASLTDAFRGEQLWTNKFDGTFEDVFTFQESVAISITAALRLKLTAQEKEKVEEHGTQNAEAYELYLKGRHEQYYNSKESYLRALDLYEQAAALDPAFARAYINIASVCCVYYREYSKNPQWLRRAEKSLAVAEGMIGPAAITLRVRGMIAWMNGDNSSALAFLLRATELDSKDYRSLNILGNIYLSVANFSEAIDSFQRAVDIEENTQAYFNLLAPLSQHGAAARTKATALKALPVFDRYLFREPNDQSAEVSRAFVLFWAGQTKEAMGAAETLARRDDLSGQALYNLGCLFNSAGQPQSFLALVRRAIRKGYRSIGQARQNMTDIEDPECLCEFQSILNGLEEIIERENAAPSD